MEEIEVPTEHLQEHIKEHAENAEKESGAHGHHSGLSLQVALSSAFIAVVAAIAALLAGHHANDAMLEQMELSDSWAFYQAKSIKAAVRSSAAEILEAVHPGVKADAKASAELAAKLEEYKKEQADIEREAHEKQRSVAAHQRRYRTLAHAVTLSQVGIAMAAMAVLTHRRLLWYVSLALGIVGAFFLAQGVL